MKKVTNSLLWIFAIGQFGWSLLSGIITNWLVFFYEPSEETVALGQTVFTPQGTIFIGLTLVGLISAFGRIFDAVTDPLIASASDRCRSKAGRRIPFMRAAAIPFGIVTFLIFMSPINGTSPVNGICLFVLVTFFYLCMTLYCTPFNALIPELGKNQKDRINLSTYISMTFILGTAVSYLMPNIAAAFEATAGYVGARRIAIAILVAVGVVCMLVPSFAIKETDYCNVAPSNTPAFKSLGKTFKNKQFRVFVSSDVFYWIALAMFQTGLPFYITSLMKLDQTMSFVLFALMTACSLLFYIPVNIFAKRIGKKRIVLFAFFFYATVFAVTTFSGMFGISSIVWGIAIAVLASVPMAILGILPQAMVADIAECDALETGENREGMFFAARTFAFKLGQSVAMLLFTTVSGFGENGFGYRATAAVAAVLCLVGAVLLIRFDEKKIMDKLS
jgi:GPH family glycoside/pentoside/hexuronide:cation symporter